MKPKVTIVNTSTTSDGDNLYMYLVDPNPDKLAIYNSEDYFLYVNLTAFPKNRSVIIEDNDNLEFESSDKKVNIVSYISTTKQNDNDYVTSNYLNVDGTESSIEGFGIESIHIENKANYIPKVTIEFFDVKGSSLKEFDIAGGSQDSNNPLGVFFSQPYPLFKLTIKGFYGKAVNYCLHFIKMDASFDSKSGGFRIKAEFIGYTYAFFADIPMRYLYALPNTPEGRKKLEELDSISFSDLLNSYTQLTRFVENYKNNNQTYERLRKFNTILTEINNIQNLLGHSIVEDNSSLFGSLIGYDGLDNTKYIFVQEIGLFNITQLSEFNNFKNELKIKINNFNQLVEEIGLRIKKLNIIIENDDTILTAQESIDRIKEKILENDSTFYVEDITEELIASRFDGFLAEPNQTQFFIRDLNESRSTLKNLYEQISNSKKELENSVVDNINQEILTRFNPTVDTLFEIIASNIEVFLSLLYDYSYAAARPEIQEARLNAFSGILTDVKEMDVIHPFPDVIINNERSWLGELDKINKEVFPEIKFINLLVNSILDVNNLQSKVDYTLKLYDGINKDDEAWFPINPLDYNNNDYNNIDVNNPLQDFYYTLLKRFLILRNYSRYADSGKLSKLWSNIEAIYANEIIENETLKNLVINNAPDIDQLLLNAQNDNVIFELQGYDLVNPSLSNIEFSSGIAFLFKSQNEDIFNSLRNKNNSYSANIYDFIENNNFYSNISNDDNFDISIRDFLFKDYTLTFFNTDLINKLDINNIVELTNLSTIDGSELPNSDSFSETIYNLNANNLICRNLYDSLDYKSYYSIFDYPNFYMLNSHLQNFLILDNLGFEKDISYFFESFTEKAGIYQIDKLQLLYVGCIIHLSKILNEGGILELDTDIETIGQLLIGTKLYDFIYTLSDYNPSLIEIIENYYLDYDFSTWVGYFSNYTNTHKQKTMFIHNNDIDFNTYVESYNFILNLYKKTEYILVPSPIFLFNDLYSNHEKATSFEIEDYISNFRQKLKLEFNNTKNLTSVKNSNERVLNDKNFLIEIYNDIKAIYDKWIGYGIKDGKIFNVCFDLKNKRLFDHFYFIDRSWNYIGNKAIINPRTILSLFKNDTINCYQYMTHILNNNNFLTFFAPSYIGLNNEEDLVDMFTPQTSLENMESAPSMIAMYIGNVSKFLDSDVNYNGDGFSITSEDLPKEFSSRKKSDKHVTSQDINKYNISSFLVNFGDQNQSHFTDININTEEHQNTAEYLRTLSDIIDKGGAIKRFYKGVDLYDIYKLRSYTCTVGGLGNMMIQPYQYFQLNVPMFKGAYIITSVMHDLKPHHHTTQFKGYKVSKYLYPLVEEITSYVDLSLSEAYDSSTIRLDSPEILEDSIGFDQGIQISTITPTTVDQAGRLLFSILNENNDIVEYRLADNLTTFSFESNLLRVFKNNASEMDRYGLSGGYCMSWVKNVMADLGIYSIPFGGVDAWDMFAGLSSSKLKYFDYNFSPNNQSRTYDYSSLSDKLNFVFGYFNSSRFKNVSINAIKNKNDQIKINKLTELNRTSLEFNPITHIGIIYNGIYYDFVNNKVRQNPQTGFVPIAYYELYNDIVFKL